MKYFTELLLVVAAGIYCMSCSHNHDHDHHDHADGHEHHDTEETISEDNHKHDNDEIILKPETAERFGVKTMTLIPGKSERSIKVSGIISGDAGDNAVIAAPTSGMISYYRGISEGKSVSAGTGIASVSAKGMTGGDTNAAAKARLDAARRELDRMTPLHDEGIVSTRDYNAAILAYDEAKAAYSARGAAGVATSPISGTITSVIAANGQFVNAGDPIATVAAGGNMILRADVPEKYYHLIADIYDANIKLSYCDSVVSISSIGGHRVKGANVASATRPGYIPVVFSFDNSKGNLVSGAAAEIYLKLHADDGENSISVPNSALSEQQGNFFVYVKIDGHGYRKTLVTTAGSDGENTIITSGVTSGDEVVVKGTSVVRMAETSGVVPEGHHHH